MKATTCTVIASLFALLFQQQSVLVYASDDATTTTVAPKETCPADIAAEFGVAVEQTVAFSTGCDILLTTFPGTLLGGGADAAAQPEGMTEVHTLALNQALVDAINDANAAGDDRFKPLRILSAETTDARYVGDGEPGDAGNRRAQLYGFVSGYFRYIAVTRCQFCTYDNKDGRRDLLGFQEHAQEDGTKKIRQMGSRNRELMDGTTITDDNNEYEILNVDQLVSDRMVDLLVATGLPNFQAVACLILQCEGSEYVDISENCPINIDDDTLWPLSFDDDAKWDLWPDPVLPERLRTAAPTAAPTGVGGGGFCFPGSMLVETLKGETMRMENLKIGDFVKTADSTFEEVYSFGHYNPNAVAEYVEINSSLRLSANHMVFFDTKHAIAASELALGDTLWRADGGIEQVKSLRFIKAKGAFAPFTKSGTIAVNGVVASNYVNVFSTDHDQRTMMLTFFTMQWMAHVSQAPHRLFYFRLGVKAETYTTAGISKWIAGAQLASAHWFLDQPVVVQGLLGVPVIAALALVDFVEKTYYPILLSVMGAAVVLHFSSSIKKKNKAKLA